MYVADRLNSEIRHIDLNLKNVSWFSGIYNTFGNVDGPPSSAEFDEMEYLSYSKLCYPIRTNESFL